jgi:hypothetical protein
MIFQREDRCELDILALSKENISARVEMTGNVSVSLSSPDGLGPSGSFAPLNIAER